MEGDVEEDRGVDGEYSVEEDCDVEAEDGAL